MKKDCATAVVLAVLAAAWSNARGDGEALTAHFEPLRIAVPMVDTAPTVDGRIDDGEYALAACVRGYMTIKGFQLNPGPGMDAPTYLLNCRDRLHLAVRWSLADQTAIKADHTRRDESLWLDDSIEVHLMPPGDGSPDRFQFVANPSGAFFDSKNSGHSWDGDVEYRCTVTNGLWTAEMSIPLGELRAGGFNPTETWRINVCRNKYSPTFNWLHLAMSTMYHYPKDNLGYLHFRPEGPAVQLLAYGDPFAGHCRPEVRIVSSEGAPRVVLELSSVDGDGRELGTAREERTVPAEAEQTLSIAADAPGKGFASTRFRVTDADSGEVLYHQTFRYAYDSYPVRMTRRYFPSTRLLTLDMLTDRLPLSCEGKELRGSVSLVSRVRHVTVFEESLPPFRRGERLRFATTLPADLAGDFYRIVVRVRDGDGATVGEAREPFRFFDRFLWEGNRIGISDTPPPPYENIRATGPAVTVVGREWSFGRTLLPSHLRVRGREMLAAPIRLLAGAGEAARPIEGTCRLLDANHVLARYALEARWGTLPITGTVEVEYDGMMRYDLDLPKGLALDGLRLDVPLKPELGKLYTIFSDRTYLESGGAVEGWIREPFAYQVWLGDDHAGIAWFAEWDKDWRIENRDACIEVFPDDDATHLLIHFVDHPVVLDNDWRLTFGLIPTPVRPMAPGWRAQHPAAGAGLARMPDFARNTHNVNYMPYVGGGPEENSAKKVYFGWPEPLFNMHAYDLGIEKAAVDHGCYQLPYTFPGGFNRRNHIFEFFKDEWYADADAAGADYPDGPYGPTGRIAHGSQSWEDFSVWTFMHHFSNHLIGGYYLDGMGGRSGSKVLGHTYVTPDGKTREYRPWFAIRRKMKRIYTAMKQGTRDYAVLMYHNPVSTDFPLAPFCDFLLSGECFNSVVDDDYVDAIPSLAFIRAMHGQGQSGVRQVWLPVLADHAEPEVLRQGTVSMLAVMLLHDIETWPAYRVDRSVCDRVWRAMERFDTHGATFHGYWAPSPAVGADREGVYLSHYRQPGRVLLVVSNLGESAVRTALHVDRDRVGLARGGLQAMDMMNGRSLALDGETLAIDVDRHGFRLVALGTGRLDHLGSYGEAR